MTAHIIRGNALALPLADDSVDLVVTSPPYFSLRSYQDGGEHYAGQIGSEATPAEFVDALIAATREMVRVVKPSGSIWVNLGDKYASSGTTPIKRRSDDPESYAQAKGLRTRPTSEWFPHKSLMGLPWRYALRCIDDLGLILRAEIIWAKPNGLPESVTDRVRRSHEQWFCFQQSSGVESGSQGFPFCPLCGRPVDARATLIARLKECDGGGESFGMPDDVRPDVRVDGEDTARGDHEVAVGLGCAPVPMLEAFDAKVGVDAAHLGEDCTVPVVDADTEQWATLTPDQRDGAFSVDDSGKPAEVCECVGHPLIINDEPWIPQGLAAEIAQLVADGKVDPQQAADFLSGDYVRNHSVWFHFTLQPRYFSAVDEIREDTHRVGLTWAERKATGARTHSPDNGHMSGGPGMAAHALGKLPGSVWEIPTQPLTVPPELGIDHFAAFPMEWPRRIIQGWSPAGVCTACGEGRRPIKGIDWSKVPHQMVQKRAHTRDEIRNWCADFARWCTETGITRRALDDTCGTNGMGYWWTSPEHEHAIIPTPEQWAKLRDRFDPPARFDDLVHLTRTIPVALRELGEDVSVAGKHRMSGGGLGVAVTSITGYACACPDTTAPTTPAVILDPFGGTGTTALLAKALGRTGISVDMSADYCRLAQWRTTDEGELARAMQVEKPAKQIEGQISMLDLLDEEGGAA